MNFDIDRYLPAATSEEDQLLAEQQAATYMAFQDVEIYIGYLMDKVKDPQLLRCKELINQAHTLFKEVHF